MPARTAAMSQLVPKPLIGNAMALNTTAMSLMSIAAPAVGGILYELIQPEGVYFVVTVMMLMAVAFTSLLPKMYPDTNQTSRKESPIVNIKRGFRYAIRHRLIRILLLQSVVIAMLSMPFRMLVPVFAKELYGSVPSEVGWIAMMAGVGGIAASIGVASLRQGQKSRLGHSVIAGHFWRLDPCARVVPSLLDRHDIVHRCRVRRNDTLGAGTGVGDRKCEYALPRSNGELDDDDLRSYTAGRVPNRMVGGECRRCSNDHWHGDSIALGRVAVHCGQPID